METTNCVQITTNNLSVEEYCDKYEIPYCFFNLKVQKIENPTEQQIKDNKLYNKIVKDLPAKWKELNYKQLNEKYNNKRRNNKRHYNAMAIDCNQGKRVIADLDGHNHQEKLIQYGNHWVTRSTTRKLPHIWYMKHSDDKNTTKINAENGIDLIYHVLFEWRDSRFENCDKPMRTFQDFQEVVEETKKKTNKTKKRIVLKSQNREINREYIVSAIGAENTEIIDNISPEHIDNYAKWLSLIWALYNEFGLVEVCDYLSLRGDPKKYKGTDDVKKFIMNDTKQAYNYGTVIHWSKKSNLENYIFIRTKYSPTFIDGSDGGLAEVFLKVQKDNIINHNGCIYIFKNPYWVQISNDKKELFNMIKTTLIDCISINMKKIDKDDDNYIELKQGYKKLMNLVNSTTKIKNVITQVISDEDLMEKDYNMNMVKPHYFCFANCAFDLKTKQKVEVDRYDYISLNTNYDYVEPTKEQTDFMNGIINQILPEDDSKECVLSVLKCGMIGELIEKFVLFNGQGRNGKGLILAFYKGMMGKYCSDAEVTLLTGSKLNSGSANTELASLENKRACIFSEPEHNQKINSGSMKQLTGNGTLKGRGLYQDAREFTNVLMGIMECNVRPHFTGGIDNALFARIVDIYFSQTFTDDEEDLKKPNHHKKNPALKDKLLINKHVTALFHILMDTDYFNVYEPPSVKTRGKKFLLGADELLEWFNEYYELVEDQKQRVKLKDVFIDFKNSEYYQNFTKEEKRSTWNKQNFIDNIERNIHLKQYCGMYNNVNVLKNHVRKASW